LRVAGRRSHTSTSNIFKEINDRGNCTLFILKKKKQEDLQRYSRVSFTLVIREII